MHFVKLMGERKTMLRSALLILCVANDVSFGLSIYTVFVAVKKNDARSYGVVKISLVSFWVLTIWRLLSVPLPNTSLAIAGLVAQAAAACLFWTAVPLARRGRFSIIYSLDVPNAIERRGPYRYIRHPFYTSYLLSYFGVALATLWWPLAALSVFMVALYQHASRFEESKFLGSALGAEYRSYMHETGRFVPRLSLKGMDVN